jgi:hypothetical protein
MWRLLNYWMWGKELRRRTKICLLIFENFFKILRFVHLNKYPYIKRKYSAVIDEYGNVLNSNIRNYTFILSP